MREKSASAVDRKKKPKLADKIRDIADNLKFETEVQMQATSRILGAAAQISENHDKLIDEVIEMVNDDLNQQHKNHQGDIENTSNIYSDYLDKRYNIESLKQHFKTLREAKEYFQIKANSWESLVNKLHQSSLPNNGLVIYLEPDVAEIFPNSQSVNEALRFLIVNQKKDGLI